MRQEFFSFKALVFIVLVLFGIGYIPQAFAVAEGLEPNNTCTSATDFGAITLPFAVEGNLDASVSPDIDFFKFVGTPGDTINVDLKSLEFEAFVGFLDSSCNVRMWNDTAPFATGTIKFRIPEDGIFIVAANGCCDSTFQQGNGNGSYQIKIRHFDPIGSISGRLKDDATGQPLTQLSNPFAVAVLLKCDESGCFPVSSIPGANAFPDNLGNFVLNPPGSVLFFETGTYLVKAFSPPYKENQTEIFTMAVGENKNVGDIALQPPIFIGSISGQVVDAVTGLPLPGNANPFTKVILSDCSNFGRCFDINQVIADNEGKFQFSTDNSGIRLLAGVSYKITVVADQYKDLQKEIFQLNLPDENKDYGNIAMISFPVRFTNKIPCKRIPKKGGSCLYSVTITNGLSTPLEANAWSIIEGLLIGSGLTTFQAKPTQQLSLNPGESRQLKFEFPLPGSSVNANSTICWRTYVGRRPVAVWDPIGFSNLFCLRKDQLGFSLMPEREAQELSRKMQGKGEAIVPKTKLK